MLHFEVKELWYTYRKMAFPFIIANDILLGKWIDHFNCEYKKAKFKAENADGVGTPARLSNAEICFFW